MGNLVDEVSYGDHPLQNIKLFNFSPKNKRTIVFIHGGAWRDPNNTFMDFAKLIDHLLDLPSVNLVGINYRLSPEHKHPAHVVDVVNAIHKIETMAEIGTTLSLVGHSVGATLLLQVLNYKEIIERGNLSQDEIRVPDLKLDLRTMVFVDGIFDVMDLIAEYGAPYKLFVDLAFESEEHYSEASQMTWSLPSTPFSRKFYAVVVQSKQDELLSERQSTKFVQFLKSREINHDFLLEDWGQHEEVYTREELAPIIKEFCS